MSTKFHSFVLSRVFGLSYYLKQVKIPEMMGTYNQPAKRVWGVWATAGFGIIIGVAALFTQFAVIIITAAVIFASNINLSLEEFISELSSVNGLYTALAAIASSIVGGGILLIVIIVRKGASISEYLALRRISWKAVLLSLVVITVLIVISDVTSFLLGRQLNADYMEIVYSTSVSPVLLWLGVVVFAPLFEEAFFRGFMFTGFIGSRLGLTGTVIITSLVWTILHIFQYGMFELTVLFISGILLGLARYRTGSLFTPLLMHSFMNAAAMVELTINVNNLIG